MATQEESQMNDCKEFLQKFERWADPTWGFFVYGTYTRPQGQEVSNEDTDRETRADATDDDAHFQAVIRKVYAHATDNLRYSNPAPYNQKMIDILRLDPAAYMPGASLDVVCRHFRQHYAQKVFPETMHEPGPSAIQDDIPNEEKLGPKWAWCIVIDDEALESLENGPEPIGETPPEGGYKLHSDVTTLTRPYTFLVAVTPKSSTIMRYGAPSSPSIQLHTQLTPAQIRLIQSHEDFGEVRVPVSELNLSNFLRNQIDLEASSQDTAMVSKLVARLRDAKAGDEDDGGDEGGHSVLVHILSFTVLGGESGELVPEGRMFLWKWAKPHSQYRKAGFWGHSLTQVLVDAEWNTGKDVTLYVKAVEEEEYERVLKGEMQT
ncbi:uncharacterized protein J4E78_006184 [Alternaria triticimaculans]|uniref:uncharacterized protein n=1 Tax=Alternaria triticimaculans TaxID=297637 RepID=UPI0020C40460|nr:uncharacterized protein J4E78_006184 [Alternaria triticimaculans]KAI4657795.1 hypothetical protein J4E78_006184 [Alternaria triticimaculans]